jgi:hypothetical protein
MTTAAETVTQTAAQLAETVAQATQQAVTTAVQLGGPKLPIGLDDDLKALFNAKPMYQELIVQAQIIRLLTQIRDRLPAPVAATVQTEPAKV